LAPAFRKRPIAGSRTRSFLFFFFLGLFLAPAAQAAPDKADTARREVRRLSGEEAKLSTRLEALLSRIADLEGEVGSRQRDLDAIASRQAEARAQREALMARRAAGVRELDELLRAIWPAHLSRAGAGLAGARSWAEADRRLTWLTAIYGAVGRKQRELADQAARLTENQDRQTALIAQSREALARVNRLKDGLLAEKLALLAEIKLVRDRKLTAEEELKEVLATVQDMRYQEPPPPEGAGDFESGRGKLPWPAAGRVVEEFDASASPPRRGLGLALAAPGPVRAVARGRVVHNDTLRGFGRVVILSHGQEYYTLYAYLSESGLSVGREVARGEPVGEPGFYPRADGPGVYFELRFHQKPINPKGWLAEAP
jgi:septal ring factor EnvC (AmiA/AmiB activator)